MCARPLNAELWSPRWIFLHIFLFGTIIIKYNVDFIPKLQQIWRILFTLPSHLERCKEEIFDQIIINCYTSFRGKKTINEIIRKLLASTIIYCISQEPHRLDYWRELRCLIIIKSYYTWHLWQYVICYFYSKVYSINTQKLIVWYFCWCLHTYAYRVNRI